MSHRVSAESVTDRRAYSIPELARLYPVSIGFLRGEIRRGALRARRFGRRVIVLREDWESYIEGAQHVNAGPT